VTGGWISQGDRSRWQQRAAAELAAILAAHPGIPVIAWTVIASGGALSGQVLAPPRSGAGCSGNGGTRWGWTRSPRPRLRAGRLSTCTLAVSSAASR
jgi:hypothetical protein